MESLEKHLLRGCLEKVKTTSRDSFLVRDRAGVVVWQVPRNALQPLELGLVYEKHVGQYLQARGYDVIFRGLQMGLLDGGVDLVACRGTERPLFVQCKYKSRSKLSLQRIERILYRGGNFIARERGRSAGLEHGALLALAVPSIEGCFAAARGRPVNQRFPVLNYFLSKRDLERNVHTEILEVPL